MTPTLPAECRAAPEPARLSSGEWPTYSSAKGPS